MAPECVDVGGMHIKPFGAEELGEFGFLGLMLGGAPGKRLVGSSLEGFLLFGGHVIPHRGRDCQQIEGNEMRGQCDLLHHLVEPHILNIRQRIVLPVDRPGLQAGIGFGIGHRGRVGADGLPQELPCLTRRHAQTDSVHVLRGHYLVITDQTDMTRAKIRRAQDVNAQLLLGQGLHFLSGVTFEECQKVIHIAEQIGRGQDRPCRDLVGDVLRGDVAHLQIAALQGDQFRTLAEQCAAVVHLEAVIFRDRFL